MKIDRRIGWRSFTYWRTLFDGPARVTVPFPERADLAGGKFRVILDREELRAIGTVTSKGEPPCP